MSSLKPLAGLEQVERFSILMKNNSDDFDQLVIDKNKSPLHLNSSFLQVPV